MGPRTSLQLTVHRWKSSEARQNVNDLGYYKTPAGIEAILARTRIEEQKGALDPETIWLYYVDDEKPEEEEYERKATFPLTQTRVKLAKRYLEQTDTTIAFTHHKNMLENMQLPKIHTTNSWKSSALPQKTTSTNRGILYRSQLSNSNKTPFHLPMLSQVQYHSISQPKTVHNMPNGLETGDHLLQIQKINHYVPPLQHKVLPPIQNEKQSIKVKKRPHVDNPKRVTDAQGNAMWKNDCECTRCELIKVDFAAGGLQGREYTHWGNYPCVPDATINREDVQSSIYSDGDT